MSVPAHAITPLKTLSVQIWPSNQQGIRWKAADCCSQNALFFKVVGFLLVCCAPKRHGESSLQAGGRVTPLDSAPHPTPAGLWGKQWVWARHPAATSEAAQCLKVCKLPTERQQHMARMGDQPETPERQRGNNMSKNRKEGT